MNRIKNFVKQESSKNRESKKEPMDLPTTKISCCSFCTKPLRPSDAGQFSAFSRPKHFGAAPESAICRTCIKRLSVMARFTENFQIYFWQNPNYSALKTEMLQRVHFLPGSTETKNRIVDLVIHLLVRKSARMNRETGDHCPIMKISLDARRIAFVGNNWQSCQRIFQTACEVAGLGFMTTMNYDLASGEAYKKLINEAGNGESAWAKHDILFCEEASTIRADCNVIFACQTAEGIGSDIEIVNLD